MSKKICMRLAALLILAALTGCARAEEEGGMDAVQTRIVAETYGVIEYISVVTNTAKVTDQEACAEEIIEHCINNDFQSVRFSYDRGGYPVELHAEVYLTQEDMRNGTPVFTMDYVQDEGDDYQYNIKDHPEKFRLIINEE